MMLFICLRTSVFIPLAARRCPTLSSPSHGSLVCSNPHREYSFASVCTSTCAEGFVLNGTAITECTPQGRWNRDIPHCLGKNTLCINIQYIRNRQINSYFHNLSCTATLFSLKKKLIICSVPLYVLWLSFFFYS